MLELFTGSVLGAVLMYGMYTFFSRKRSRSVTLKQSSVLLEKIRAVSKLISVEGDFAEIYRYENQKDHFGRLFSTKKKALIVIKARAHVGYDFKKLVVVANPDRKTVVLKEFPQPEVLSVEPELEFYDIRNGIFNPFTPDDLTALNREAKEHIREKIPESGLMEAARKEALEAILVMESIVGTIGWKLDYEALKLDVPLRALEGSGEASPFNKPNP
ncbi:DUF4230 domain-containing protein [Robiginitalea sp. M366]|uniref:DUF4230 domain-containing protein n=1 Tax=Robiginitalea aestuariiviva TaxID=3036903 RepID=UPI00240D38F9|nr:DUF4230 domain-containing protein [Robiginitalea aestuariiviva]MDG1571095.1 DUF4230 domain-containing protein [Robiginitalea aestuariiviva]